MPLNFYNENENQPEGEFPEERQMTAEEMQAFIRGDLDPTDDDVVRKIVGQKGLEGVQMVEATFAELQNAMRQMIHQRDTQDPALPMTVFIVATKIRDAIRSLDEEKLVSLLGLSLTQNVMLEKLMLDALGDDDDDDGD